MIAGSLTPIRTLTVLAVLAATMPFAGPAMAEMTYFEVELKGGADTDRDGVAHGTLSIDSETGRIVWGLYYSGIEAPTAMHIHSGAAGESGGVVVALNVDSKLGEGALTGTVDADPATVGQILAAPENFYVNIHTGEFRGGAVRAQLGTRWSSD
jgi:hypothetical protein